MLGYFRLFFPIRAFYAYMDFNTFPVYTCPDALSYPRQTSRRAHTGVEGFQNHNIDKQAQSF